MEEEPVRAQAPVMFLGQSQHLPVSPEPGMVKTKEAAVCGLDHISKCHTKVDRGSRWSQTSGFPPNLPLPNHSAS
jgi:hypothetical protein